jgi:predicted nucleotidyltransferase component of viral defense system
VTKQTKDVGASVKAQLLRLARSRGDDYQLLLLRYANERLLYRLAVSPYASRFVLKGAAMFTLWAGLPHRATRDIDLHGIGDPSEAHVRKVMLDVISQPVDDDGVLFDAETLTVAPIREDQAYGGVRVALLARIASAQIRLQIDVGFGDAITPEATSAEFPALLDFPAPRLLVYPRETVIAEKLEAIVQLGMANSRMKDFYDIVVLANSFEFQGQLLLDAIRATFKRRGTTIPKERPVAFTSTFTGDASKTMQWTAFVKKSGIDGTPDLGSTVAAVAAFLKEPLAVAITAEPFAKHWSAKKGWN